MKKLIYFLLVFISGLAIAQTEPIAPEYVLTDSVDVLTTNGDLNLGSNGSGLIKLYNDTDWRNTGYIKFPSGTTAQRPTASNAMARYNTTTNKFEGYENGAWENFITSGSLTFGTDNQIPYTNSAGDDFDYSSSFTFDGSALKIGGGSQSVEISNSTNDLLVQGATVTTDFILEIAAQDNDGTDDVAFEVDAVGLQGGANREDLWMGWDAGNSQFEIRSESAGSGTARALSLFTPGNQDQLKLNTNGTVSLLNDLAVTEGGSGVSTLTGIVQGNGTSAFTGITTSAGISGAISDETGSGALVFGTSPTIGGTPSAASATWSNLGAVTTVDINGGTIDGTTIGATTPAAGVFTKVTNSAANNSAFITDNTSSPNGIIDKSNSSATALFLYGTNVTPIGWYGTNFAARLESYGYNSFEIGSQQNIPVVLGTNNLKRLTIEGNGDVKVHSIAAASSDEIVTVDNTGKLKKGGTPLAKNSGTTDNGLLSYVNSNGKVDVESNLTFSSNASLSTLTLTGNSTSSFIYQGSELFNIEGTTTGSTGGITIISNNTSTDTGSDPVFELKTQNSTAAFVNRPTLAGYNYTTKQWQWSAGGSFDIFNATTVPTSSVTDGIRLYAEDVSSSSELKVRDEAGNVTTLSPHNFSKIPEGPSEEMAWSFYSERDGKYVTVDMLKLARLMEKLTGEKLVYIGKTDK